MKNLTIVGALGFSMMSLAVSARADEEKKDHPCKPIHEACEAAGFKKGDHKDKKGLYADCIKPILAGTAVPGVTVTPEAVAACNAAKSEHHKH